MNCEGICKPKQENVVAAVGIGKGNQGIPVETYTSKSGTNCPLCDASGIPTLNGQGVA